MRAGRDDVGQDPTAAEPKKPRLGLSLDNRLNKTAIEVIAQALPWSSTLTESATTALALDGEYRIREIVQDSIKYMKHSKRSYLTPQDVNAALKLRDVAPVYGFGGTKFARLKDRERGARNASFRAMYDAMNDASKTFQPVEGTESLFYTEDKETSILGLLERKPPKLPIRTTISAHWLAVDCTQPTTNQNPGKLLHTKRNGKSEDTDKESGRTAAAVEVKPIVKHDLSLELQLYYEQITSAVTGTDLQHLETCLSSVKIQTGLEQMLPYLTQFIFRTVTKSTQDLPVLFSAMRLTKTILSNSAFNVEHYLQQLLPAIVTCIVGKRLCSDPWENHWALREFSVKIATSIFEKFGKRYPELRPKFTATMETALKDLKRPLTTHYGAIVGVASFGAQTVKLYLLPRLKTYAKKLRPLLVHTSIKPIRRLEAAKVAGAILRAAPMALGTESAEPGDVDLTASSANAVVEELKELEGSLKQELTLVHAYQEGLSETQLAEFLHHHKRLELDRNSKKS